MDGLDYSFGFNDSDCGWNEISESQYLFNGVSDVLLFCFSMSFCEEVNQSCCRAECSVDCFNGSLDDCSWIQMDLRDDLAYWMLKMYNDRFN